MRVLIAALALTGCNQIFGLESTVSGDASVSFFDAGPDAMPVCGDPSVTPTFSTELHQVVFSNAGCANFQTSSIGLSFAICAPPPDYILHFREGHVGDVSELALTRGDLDASTVFSASLTPEGNEIYAVVYDATAGFGVWRFERDAIGAWIRKEQTTIPFGMSKRLSTVSRGPRRRLFVVTTNTQFVEYEQDAGGTWTNVGNYTASNFGVQVIFTMSLSADGLRLLGNALLTSSSGEATTVYAYRASINDRFSAAMPVPTAPASSDLFMTEDCDRVYFSGLSSVFYARRTN